MFLCKNSNRIKVMSKAREPQRKQSTRIGRRQSRWHAPSGRAAACPQRQGRLVPGGRGGLSPAAEAACPQRKQVACPRLADAQEFEVELAVRPQGPQPWVDRRRPGWCHRRGLRRSGTYVRTNVRMWYVGDWTPLGASQSRFLGALVGISSLTW